MVVTPPYTQQNSAHHWQFCTPISCDSHARGADLCQNPILGGLLVHTQGHHIAMGPCINLKSYVATRLQPQGHQLQVIQVGLGCACLKDLLILSLADCPTVPISSGQYRFGALCPESRSYLSRDVECPALSRPWTVAHVHAQAITIDRASFQIASAQRVAYQGRCKRPAGPAIAVPFFLAMRTFCRKIESHPYIMQ